MQTLTADPDLFAYAIGPRHALRILEQAIRARARITLEPRAPVEGPPLVGPIVTAAPESVCIELDDPIAVVPHALTTINCDAALALGHERYLFTTNIMAVVDTDLPTRLEIARPRTLHVMQRRRFWRSVVHESSPVEFFRTTPADPWHAWGTLLNAGFDGIACKMLVEDAANTGVGDRMRIRFALQGCDEPFDFEAEVRSKQPAGTDGFMIVGLQFSPHERFDEQRRRVARTLGHDLTADERTGDHE